MNMAWLAGLWLAFSVQATEREVYAPALEEAPWQFEQTDQQCRLLQHVPRVGDARFLLDRSGTLQFDLQGFRHPAGDTLALIRLDPPAWQHGKKPETLQEIRLSPAGELALLKPRLANRLLQELEHGRIISLFFPDWADAQHALTIRLLPVGFRPALRDFLACPDQLPPPPKVELPPQPPRYTVWFATDRAELTEDAMGEIRKICDDVKRYGDAVQQVLLQARADERGSEAYNQRLSEDRAQAVAEALVEGGVPEEKLHILALGESRPDPAGDDPAAWRKNRRVEVTLLGEQGQPPELPRKASSKANPEEQPPSAPDAMQAVPADPVSSGEDG